MVGEARRRGATHIRQLIVLGDGAVWIWNLAGPYFPKATQIVDLFRAREHLHDLAKLLEFMLGDYKQDWLDARLAELDAGDIPAICASARAFPLTGRKAADLTTALGYFEHNAHRIRYRHFSRSHHRGIGPPEEARIQTLSTSRQLGWLRADVLAQDTVDLVGRGLNRVAGSVGPLGSDPPARH